MVARIWVIRRRLAGAARAAGSTGSAGRRSTGSPHITMGTTSSIMAKVCPDPEHRPPGSGDVSRGIDGGEGLQLGPPDVVCLGEDEQEHRLASQALSRVVDSDGSTPARGH